MATLKQVMDAIRGQILPVVTGLTYNSNPVNVTFGEGWPPANMIQTVVGTQNAIVNIYDYRQSKDTTRWPVRRVSEVNVTATTIAVLNNPTLVSGGTVTITLSGTPTVNDAIAFVANNARVTSSALVTAISGDTATTLATKLAAAINTAATLNTWVSATSLGAAVTVTSLVGNAMLVQANVGNQSTFQQELRRVVRRMWICVWVGAEAIREVVGDPIEDKLSLLQSQYGVTFSDGTWLKFDFVGDIISEEDILVGVYRRNFFIDVEYGISPTQTATSVLVEKFSLTPPS